MNQRPSPHADWALGSAEPRAQPALPCAGEGSRPAYRDKGSEASFSTDISPSPAHGRGGRGVRATRLLAPLIVLALLGLWQGVTSALHLQAWLLPSPGDIVAAFRDPDTQAQLTSNLWPTVEEALVGFICCCVVGVALAWAMAASRIVRDALYPLLIASQAIPIIAIAAVLVVVFGFGLTPKVIVVVLYSFFAVTVNVYDALETLDPELPGLLRTLGASRWDIVRTARIPAALPGFFTGAKLAVTYSVAAAVFAELVGATGGLGPMLITAANGLKEPQVFAVMVVLALLSVVGFAVVALLEWLLVPWARRGG